MVDLDPGLVAALAVGAAALSVIAVGVAVALALRLRRLRREQLRALGDDATVIDRLARQGDEVEVLRGALADLDIRASQLRALLGGAVSKVGMVRYDAFEDMGGALSFSAALLNEGGDGIVVSAINGRSETRCYAKPVRGGASEFNLSGEEAGAIDRALSGHTDEVTPRGAGRRRRSAS